MADQTLSDLARFKTSVVLKDGSTLFLRAIQPEDEDGLLAFFDRLSRQTVYLRFRQALTQLSREEARALCAVDYDNSFGLVAIIKDGETERIVGVANYRRLPHGDSAEVDFVVEDAYQGKGIGTHLLEKLAALAREKGIRVFEGEVLAENQEMIKVFESSGFRVTGQMEQGVHRVLLDIAPTTAVEVKSGERDRIATVASLMSFFKPHSVAVIGASRKPGTIGNTLFQNILLHGFSGVAYPVNPNTEAIASVKAYRTVLDITEPVDLAVIIVPAEAVQTTVQQCGRKGVRGIIVISDGFAESGAEGKVRQDKLLETVRGYGMRVIGPNCMGVINTDKQVSLNATFSPVFPPAGNIAFCTQSGALGLAILEYARTLNIGLSGFASIGNRADVSSNDFLQDREEDAATKVILLYLESIGNPQKFGRIARRISLKKPLVAVKSGRTPAGLRAAASHTGALATNELASEALFAQTGVIRVDTLAELFDIANFLSHQPLPRGRRIAVLTNGGGPGILTADACSARGLELPSLAEGTVVGLKAFLRKDASVINPIDMTAEANARDYSEALKLLAQDENVDIVIVIFVPPVVAEAEAVAAAIREVSADFRRRGKPLVASFMGARGVSIELGSEEECCVPSFAFPEETAITLAKACEYNDWLNRPKGTFPSLAGMNKEKAMRVIGPALSQTTKRPLWLGAAAVNELLDCYGIRTVLTRMVTSPAEAAAAAKEIGFPVAVKLLSDTITHKTEVGGVVLDLHSPREVEWGFAQIREHLAGLGKENEMQGVVVQQMLSEGIEVIAGFTRDPSFGPLILFGMGGIYTELLKDVALRIHPLSDVDAREMIRSVKAYRLLEGWRGAKPADIPALEELLLRLSAMAEDLPQILELDLNPVRALETGKGYAVVDARILVS